MNPRTHVFAAAIETYQEEGMPMVAGAENDGKRFADAWRSLGVAEADSVVLINAHATLGTLPSRLKKFLQNVESGDRVVFFYVGHGFAEDGEDFLSVYDTQPDDLASTSVPVKRILSQLAASSAAEILLFISATPAGDASAISSSFSAQEVAEFCDGPSRYALLSSEGGRPSFSNLALRQGVWTQALLFALRGEAKEACGSGRVLTAASLQTYLHEEVPRLLRSSVSGNETQTPMIYGRDLEKAVIVDFNVSASQGGGGASIRDSRLVGSSQGRVRSLSGFTKFHKEPDACNSRFSQFVESLGSKEIEDRTSEIFERVRTTFQYKRKDLFFDKEGAIKTPDFEVSVRLMQDLSTPNMYLLSNEVTVSRPEVVREPAFLEVFARYCNSVIIDLAGSLDIAAKIDDLEDVAHLRPLLEYDAECTEFTLRLPGSGIGLHATRDRLKFTLAGRGDLVMLIEGTQAAMSDLARAKVSLGLPEI